MFVSSTSASSSSSGLALSDAGVVPSPSTEVEDVLAPSLVTVPVVDETATSVDAVGFEVKTALRVTDLSSPGVVTSRPTETEKATSSR